MERGQAFVRLYMLAAVTIYVGVVNLQDLVPAAEEFRLLIFVLCYAPFSAAVLAWVIRRPGVNGLRRAISIGGDYTGITWMMVFGGAPMLPVYAILLWVALGTGLRFGPRYLLVATALALLSLAVTTYFNEYWRANPYMVGTFVVTAIVVPLYVLSLLTRIQQALEAAKEANLSKSRFLAQASHDLRQPIHAISLYTACLRDAGLSPKEVQWVDSIDGSLESVARLFKSLLDISTLDSGRVTPKREPILISDVFDDVMRQNAEAAKRGGGILKCVRSQRAVEADRALLTTMLQNVVNNAIKYAPGQAILMGCRRRGRTLAIVVADRGPGIAPEHQERIFEEFYQVRQRGDRDVEGVGLGLPIVRRLAALMGLEISLRSKVGRGTCVTLAGLPLAEKIHQPPRSRRPMPASIQGLRVLLVEDDERVLQATAGLLQNWGCEVQATPVIPQHVSDCDLVITDYDLGGGMTGTECIRVVRELLGNDVPVVVMTGHDELRVREDLGEPSIPILSKPVRPAELRSVILAKTAAAKAR